MSNPIYQYATLAQVRQEISNRLYDSNQVFWTVAELNTYINEGLRTFNSLAWFWRNDFTFPLTAGQVWYDIPSQANSLRPYTVTDVQLYNEIEFMLLEPATGATWTGTQQFTIDDLINAVQRTWNELLSVTGCTITQSIAPVVLNNNRTTLEDNVLDIRRIAYFPIPSPPQTGYGDGGFGSGGFGSTPPTAPTFSNVLWPEDIWAFQAFEPIWTTQPQGTPQSYARSSEPPISFDTDVQPNLPGNYELLTVNSGSVLTSASPTIITIPDDFTWVLKWGALSDLFSKESEAQDLPRADYCRKRYEQGLQLISNSPAVLQFRMNNQPLWVDAVRTSDEYNTTWEGQIGVPTAALSAGLNLVAVTPIPQTIDLPCTATVSVLQNAPLPVIDADFVQISRDNYDSLVDYVCHLALTKCGGSEFLNSGYLFDNFVKQASFNNSKLAEMGCFKEAIYGTSQLEERYNPRMKPQEQ